jgi:3-dehydroquinate dehydratase-1
VVGTLSTFDSLLRFRQLTEKICDLAEVRLDLVGTATDWSRECNSIQASGTPVLLTLRSASEGGKSTLTDDQRGEILQKALPAVSAIDIELKSSLAEGSLVREAKRLKKPVVLSYHDFEKTASAKDLSETIAEAQKRGSVVKISTVIQSPPDVKTLESLLQKKWDVPLCVIGMGPLGSSTRVTFACAGSCLTYGYVDAPVAPGQLSARSLIEQLRRMLPAFDDDFIQRGGVRTG